LFSSVEKQQLKVPAHIDYLGDLRDFVTKIGRKHKFSDKVVNAFKLAVDEASTNIIRHAYRDSGTQGLITLRAIVKKNSLTLSVIDQGVYFDPKRVKDPDLNRYIDIGKKGGLGIFIMRKLMDEIDYRKTEEGNELRITKYRDKPAKKGVLKSVSSIPFSIKAKYFFRAIAIITAIVATGYLYFFLKTDNEIIADFLIDGHSTSRVITTRIASAPLEDFTFIEDIVNPIDEEYKGQIASISVEDSTGTIVYSSNVGELFIPFSRPSEFEQLSENVFKYTTGNSPAGVYEFESPIVIKDASIVYGKSHVFFSAKTVDDKIASIRLNQLQFALLILGMVYVGIALLIYLVMNPFRKLSDWVKNLGHGEIEDEMDIDASTEIGEIARAFSDITSKFRDSQKNLVDQERLKREMQVAQEIQQTLLPMEFPVLEGYELAAYYEAAKEVGGDYYDFVEVDKDTLGIAVADVSGKGVPGSLVMTMIRTALRTEARSLKDAAEVLARVNAFVSNDIKKGMFVTVFYLIIDSKKRSLNYASAGHNPMILYRGSTKQTYYLNPKGFPIGVQLPEENYFRNYIESDTIQLNKDDILLLYTDGITEAMNPRRELFGEERLQKVLHDYGHLSAEPFVEKLKDAIYSFTEGAPQYDDITLVAIKEESTREEDELRRAKEVHNLVFEGMSIRQACDIVNLTTYAYYNKYKKIFEEQGIDAFEIDKSISVEAKHLSIEEKTKIFDVIRNHPEYGASRIKDELKTEKYGFCRLGETRVYEELVRNRLNTKALREAFVQRAQRSKRRIKPPGTPFMTLDGEIIIRKSEATNYSIDTEKTPRPEPGSDKDTASTERVNEQPTEQAAQQELPESLQDTVISDFEVESLIDAPLEDVLAKDRPADPKDSKTETTMLDLEVEVNDADEAASLSSGTVEADAEEMTLLEDFSFEDLFGSDSEVEDLTEEFDETSVVSEEETSDAATASDSVAEVEKSPSSEPVESADLSQEIQDVAGVDEGEATLTTASLDELLSLDPQIVDEETNDFKETSAEETLEAALDNSVTQQQDDQTVSFSDLIQAIDDELVYVTEPAGKDDFVSEDDEAAPVSNSNTVQEAPGAARKQASAFSRNDDKRNGDRQRSQGDNKTDALPESKELILINGIKHYKNNDYDKAIEEFRRVIDQYPDYKEAHSILGNAYFRNKMYKEAEVEYRMVKEIDPNDVTAYENMGVIYANRGEYEQAVSQWQKVIELNPDRVDIADKIEKAMGMI